MVDSELPARLPLAAPDAQTAAPRRERGDAAANRERILCAARSLFNERGVDGTSMDAVATAAGVGKGTIFRRFGDRAGLTLALLDGSMREFQDGFLSGPPPLGPGGSAQERLEAFTDAFLELLDAHLELVLAVHHAHPGRDRSPVYRALRLHVRNLLEQLNPLLDADVTADLLLGAMAAEVLVHLRRDRGLTLADVQAAVRRIVAGLAPVVR